MQNWSERRLDSFTGLLPTFQTVPLPYEIRWQMTLEGNGSAALPIVSQIYPVVPCCYRLVRLGMARSGLNLAGMRVRPSVRPQTVVALNNNLTLFRDAALDTCIMYNRCKNMGLHEFGEPAMIAAMKFSYRPSLIATALIGMIGIIAEPASVQGAEAPPAAVKASTDDTRHWFPLSPARDDFQETILDASPWVEAPTGKHGFVTAKGERFVFTDGTPVRFWGAQMNPWGKEQVDYAVRRMRRQGINISRLHGLANLGGDAASFERLDYLLAKLGENGIYIILDLHYPLTHRFRASDNVPGLPAGGVAPFTQFFNDRVADIMHQRMTNIFTHLNPYTKKRYCDDPTLAMVEILNEDSLFWGTIPAPFRADLEDKFVAWLRQKYGDDAGLRKAWSVDGQSPLAVDEGLAAGQRIALLRNADFNERYFRAHPEQKLRGQDQMKFCLELEERYWEGCRATLRQAGIKVPIDATNWQGHGLATRVHMLGQAKLDYVDRHGYWDHPQGEGNTKWRIATAMFHNLPMVKAVSPDQNLIKYLGVGNLVIEKAWEQVLGLPMTISEWNTCLPNEYSLEGTGLMAAYGLLQGWDASLEFGYFSPDWPKALGNGSFDLLGNPPQILQFPAISVLWHRQDIQEAEVVAESLYDPASVFSLADDRKPVPLAAALVGKVGYRFVAKDRPPLVKDISKYWDATNLVARSITGELTWDAAKGCVRIDTPRTQAVIGFLSAEPHNLGAVSLKSPTRFGALYVTAMDGHSPIREARRLLITAVGPARNTGMEYAETTQKSQFSGPFWRLKSEGTAPALLEAVIGELRIQSQRAKALKAWTLDVVGKRRQAVPLQALDGTAQLQLNAQHEAVYYELSAE